MSNAYTYSRLKTYYDCPRKYKQIYIDKLRPIKPVYMVTGIILHKIIAEYFKTIKEKGACDNKVLREICAWIFFSDRSLPAAFFSEIEQLAYTAARKFRAGNYQPTNETQIETGYAVNKILAPVAYDSETAYFRGRMDRIDSAPGCYIITDYKTGWKTETDLFQLRVYAWLLSRQNFKAEKYIVRNDPIRFNKVYETELTLPEMDNVKYELITLIKMIEADTEYRPTVGAHCHSCNMPDSCIFEFSKYNHCGYKHQAEQVAKELINLECKLEHRYNLLSQYLSFNPPFVVNNEQFYLFGSKVRHKADGAKLHADTGLNNKIRVIKTKRAENNVIPEEPEPAALDFAYRVFLIINLSVIAVALIITCYIYIFRR